MNKGARQTIARSSGDVPIHVVVRDRRQTVNGLVFGVRHAQAPRLGVHHADRVSRPIRRPFGDRHGGVIGGLDQRCFHQFAQRIDVARVQAEPRSVSLADRSEILTGVL